MDVWRPDALRLLGGLVCTRVVLLLSPSLVPESSLDHWEREIIRGSSACERADEATSPVDGPPVSRESCPPSIRLSLIHI